MYNLSWEKGMATNETTKLEPSHPIRLAMILTTPHHDLRYEKMRQDGALPH